MYTGIQFFKLFDGVFLFFPAEILNQSFVEFAKGGLDIEVIHNFIFIELININLSFRSE